MFHYQLAFVVHMITLHEIKMLSPKIKIHSHPYNKLSEAKFVCLAEHGVHEILSVSGVRYVYADIKFSAFLAFTFSRHLQGRVSNFNHVCRSYVIGFSHT